MCVCTGKLWNLIHFNPTKTTAAVPLLCFSCVRKSVRRWNEFSSRRLKQKTKITFLQQHGILIGTTSMCENRRGTK